MFKNGTKSAQNAKYYRKTGIKRNFKQKIWNLSCFFEILPTFVVI
jgi:hypothetical protein